MSNKYLILVLQGPMQSWGLQGKFDHRDTASMPTKSGIVGMLGAALGVERADRVGIAELAALPMSVICVKRGELMTDFHTVGCSKSDKGIPKADGGYTQAVTHRDYLCDATFAVVITGDGEFMDRIAAALDNPKWGLFLGRKSCLPTRPILEAVVDTEDSVRDILKRLGVSEGSDCVSDGSGDGMQQDVPIDFKARRYSSRAVSRESVFVR
jgi:CRISPR system Cascade subunit CasD